MSKPRRTLLLLSLIAGGGLLVGGCAALSPRDPLNVTVVGVEPLQGEGLELRLMVRLRVQNPNDAPIEYNGVSIDMDVQGRRFASGVSDATGIVPRYGEAVIAVPVSASALRMASQIFGFIGSSSAPSPGGRKIAYQLSGKLAGSAFSSVHFSSSGEINLPGASAAGEGAKE